MSHAPQLIPNLGAEESEAAPAKEPAVQQVIALWRLLFGARARRLGQSEPAPAAAWPEALGALPEQPVYSWLDADAAFAWLNTDAAAEQARQAGTPLAGASASVVREVHDKAFSCRVCAAEGLVPRDLRGLVRVLEPEELADPERALAQIEAALAGWPAWVEGRFALKPRLGSSGRGRIPGRAGDLRDVRGALPRLVARGGAILEPWLSRREDLSVQFHVAPDGTLTLLGTLVQRMSASGLYRGHRGWVDYRVRVTSGSEWDNDLLEAGVALAQAASKAGYTGPCGIDAFDFEGPDGVAFRPAVELNARFTTGTMLIGLLRRARGWLRERLDLSPGERRPFYFGLAAPKVGWPAADSPLTLLRFGPEDDRAPALVVARQPDEIDAWLGRGR